MKLLKKLVMMVTIISFTLLTYSVSNRITNKTNSSIYNHFNPVVDGDDAVEGSNNRIFFNAFYLEDKDDDGTAEGYHGTSIRNKETDILYINIRTNGEATLRNATLTFDSKNVSVSGYIPKNSLFPSSQYSSNFGTVELSEVDDSINTLFTVNTTAIVDKIISDYETNNKIILRGELVDHETGQVTNIEKEVVYTVNSYSDKANTSFGINKSEYQENTYTVEYIINVDETSNKAPLYATYLEGSVSKLLNENPVNVNVYPEGYDNYIVNYNPVNLTFTAEKKAQIDNGTITKTAYNTISYGIRTTKWHVIVTYPAIEGVNGETVNITATAWHSAIKNKNMETFETEKVSTILSQELTTYREVVSNFIDRSRFTFGDVTANANERYVDKTPIINAYNNVDSEDTEYSEYWYLNTDLSPNYKASVIYEYSGTYVGNRLFLDNYISYRTITISPCSYKYDNKLFKVIDKDTDKIIMTIKSDDYYKEITLPRNVHRINLETDLLDEGSKVCFNVTAKKEISSSDVVSHYNENEFDYSNLNSGINVYQRFSDGTPDLDKLPHRSTASFTQKVSYVTIKTDKSTYEREVSDYNIPIKLTLQSNPVLYSNQNEWKKGYFLVEMPDFIIDIQGLNISSGVDILSKEHHASNGKHYLWVAFDAHGSNANIDVNFNAIINPLSPSVTDEFKLYGYNTNPTIYSNPVEDIYDINKNGNTNDEVAYASAYINLSVPNEVITGSALTGYNEGNDITVSPVTADVNPLRGSDNADVNIFVLNNAENDVSDMVILGRTGFVGNTYVVGSGTLGSEFDTYMNGPISIPSELNGKVIIYYSENETPTRDLTNGANGWTQTPANYNDVKSYLIDFDDDFVIEKGKRYDFGYNLKLPTSTENLNKVSYLTHGAYFKYITPSGLFPSSISGSKLGIRLARVYNAEINLYRKFTNIKIPGGLFTLIDDDGEEYGILIDGNGHALINNLRVGKTYTLVQKGSYNGTIKNDQNVVFKINNGNNDELSIDKSGDYKEITFNGTDKVNITLENDVYYTVNLYNKDIDSDAPINGTIFKITGTNYESGKNIITDQNGVATLKNLKIGEVYKVSQVYIDGYPKITNFDLRIVRDKNTHEVLLTTRQIPEFIKDSSCSSVIKYEVQSYAPEYSNIYTNQVSNSVAGTYVCDFTLALDKFTDKYNLSGTMNLYDYWGRSDDSTLYLYLTKGDNTSGLSEFASLGYDGTSYNGSTMTQDFSTDKVYYMNNLIPAVADLEGGENYNLRVVYNRSGYRRSQYTNPNMLIDSILLKPKSGIYELAQVDDKTDVQSSDNPNVYQTIIDNGLNPQANITVGNKNVEKRTFEITSVDSTDNSIIEGSQFKISGNGIPGGETIITTDENGKASLDLFLSFDGNYRVVPGIENNPDYPIESVYTIEQVYAPKGYTVNKKQVKFKMNATYDYNNPPNITNSFVYMDREVKFDSTEVTDVPVFKATLSSSPLFKLIKTDAETSEILPNTYYAIYSYNTDTQEISPAKDQYGNTIGDKLTIDGVEYYVVKTDENGEIKLALDSGSYKLIEILASDDKYEIDGEEYIFSVGDSKPYVPYGILVKNVINSIDTMSTTTTPYVFVTNDGGFVAFAYFPELHMLKYNADNELIWNIKLQATGAAGYHNYHGYEYFDDPDRNFMLSDSVTDYYDVTSNLIPQFEETSDSFYVFISPFNDFRIDKSTGDILYDIEDHPATYYVQRYTEICDNDPSTLPDGFDIDDFDTSTYENSQYILHDPNHVYCNVASIQYNSFYGNTDIIQSAFSASEKGAIRLYNLYSNRGLRANDGTEFVNTNSIRELTIAKFDKTGKMVGFIPLNSKINTAINGFIHDQLGDSAKTLTLNDTYSDAPSYNKIRYYDDGSIGMVLSLKFRDENNSNINLLVISKVDSEGNVLFAIPVGVDGFSPSSMMDYYIGNGNNYASINDDGSFSVSVFRSLKYYYFNNSTNSSYPELFQTNFYRYEFPYETPYANNVTDATSQYVLEFDKNGVFKNVVQINITYRVPVNYDDSFMYYRVPQGAASSPAMVTKYEDGYIVAGWNTVNTDNEEPLILSTGKVIDISNTGENGAYNFSVYKVNSDSTVEWFKQFKTPGGAGAYTNGMYPSAIKNNTFVFPINSTDSQLLDVYTDETFTSEDGVGKNGYFFGKFNVTDEVLPGAPTAISLNLLNYRKTFNIEIVTNAGGTFNIKNNDTVIYNGDDPGVVEQVKYGDTSVNDIIITPNSGYGIESIKINDEAVAYSVNLDGTVILNKIEDVKEDKVIKVKFKRSESRVIVHHYLEGTTNKISGDVIINGNVNDTYMTEPAMSDDYELIKDESGNVVIPSNYQGKITAEPIEVVYYYKRANAKLRVNYFLDSTDTELAPSHEEDKPLGSSYTTNPITIVKHILSGVLGEENGVLNRSFTEVSYFYNALNKTTVKIYHLDEDTNEPIADPTYEYYDVGDTYTATPLLTIPNHYLFSSSSPNVTGIIGSSDVEVTFYYAKEKGKVVTRYISKDKQIDLLPPNVQFVKYDDTYTVKEPASIPSGYRLYSKPTELSGIVDRSEINLIYIFEKIEDQLPDDTKPDEKPDTPDTPDKPDVKPSDDNKKDEEITPVIPEIDANDKEIVNPKTSDNIIIYGVIFVVSLALLISIIIIDKKKKKN